MNRNARSLALLLVGSGSVVAAVGCGGGGAKGDGGDGKVYADATVKLDTASDKNGTAGGGGSDAGPAGPPAIGTGSKLIVAGSIDLIGSGTDTCTNQVPPSGDRWCGFAKLSSDLMNYELWVVDVTKAAQGVTVQCASNIADPNCHRLSTGLYVDPSNGFRVHGFDGDTLTYSEVPSMSANGFLGNIFAWRPGWAAPRNLTGNSGFVCNGNALTNAAVCIQNPVLDPTGQFVQEELHAGFLDDVGTPLPLIDTIILVASADAQGVQKWSARLSPDGQSIAWSTRTTDTGTEDLKWQKLGDATSRVSVASDVSQWTISSDSQRWLWLKSYNYASSGAPSGTLQAAPYPAGTPPVTIASGVGDFDEAGVGVQYRTQVTTDTGVGSLLVATDRDMPASAAMLDSNVAFVFGASKDGKSVAYTKMVASDGQGNVFLFDLYVGSPGTMPCVLTSMPTAFIPPTFIGGSSLVAWGQFTQLTNEVSGVATSMPACQTRKFAGDIYDWTAIGDEGLVYLDTLDPDPAVNEATLRYGKIAQGTLPPLGTPVQVRAGLSFATLLPALDAVVYTITTSTSADGLYVNATLPFTVTTSVPDAGTAIPEAGPTDAGATETGGGDDAGAIEAGDSETGASDAQPGG